MSAYLVASVAYPVVGTAFVCCLATGRIDRDHGRSELALASLLPEWGLGAGALYCVCCLVVCTLFIPSQVFHSSERLN